MMYNEFQNQIRKITDDNRQCPETLFSHARPPQRGLLQLFPDSRRLRRLDI